MTNTLHRFGDAGAFGRLRRFRDCQPGQERRGRGGEAAEVPGDGAARSSPVNLGDARNGGALRPCKNMNPLSHWDRDMKPDFEPLSTV